MQAQQYEKYSEKDMYEKKIREKKKLPKCQKVICTCNMFTYVVAFVVLLSTPLG